MKLSQFRFDLPLNLIAQHPAKKREDARMMVVHRDTGNIENKHFRDVLDYFDDKDVFVVNNTKGSTEATRCSPSDAANSAPTDHSRISLSRTGQPAPAAPTHESARQACRRR